jgi:hypothetical protein
MLNNQLRLHPAGAPTQVGNLLSHMGNSPKFSDCKCRKKSEEIKDKSEKLPILIKNELKKLKIN